MLGQFSALRPGMPFVSGAVDEGAVESDAASDDEAIWQEQSVSAAVSAASIMASFFFIIIFLLSLIGAKSTVNRIFSYPAAVKINQTVRKAAHYRNAVI